MNANLVNRMAASTQLTILLTLKGRHLFTLRWLWHANRIKLPFRIFIADGEVHPTIARLIEDHSVFPNLLIEYHRYDDRTYSDFYQKLNDAFSKITTPYVMMSDNDDFLFPSGVIRSLECLERSSDYVCAGGGVAHFETKDEKNEYSNLSGTIEKLWYQQSKAYQSFDLDNSLASERVLDVYVDSYTVHYNVYRLETLRCIASEQLKYNFSRLESSELFWKLRTATLGKLKSDASCISYFRQRGASLNPVRTHDFIDILSASAYLDEIRTVAKLIASNIAEKDHIDADVIEKELDKRSTERLREQLMQILGWRAGVKRCFKKYLPEFLFHRLRLVGDRIRSGKSSATGGPPISREQMFKLVEEVGVFEEFVNEQRKELAEIETTLQGREVLAFIHRHAPELLPQTRVICQ